MNLAERINARQKAERDALSQKWEAEKQEKMKELGAPNYERILELVEDGFNASPFINVLHICNAGHYRPMREIGGSLKICAIAEQHFESVKEFLRENGFCAHIYGCYENKIIQVTLPQ